MKSTDKVWQKAMLRPDATVGDAIRNLNDVAIKIVLVVNEYGVLEGTLSDGDIRRGLLRGLTLSSAITTIIHRDALVVSPEMGSLSVMQLMLVNKIQQIPVVNEKRQIVGLHLWNEITAPPCRSNLMVIMAGGMGTRMRPYTEACPKPMLQVAGKPMLEHIIERAKRQGFNRFLISIHYLGNVIETYFGAGESLGVQIEYLREDSPIGTAGALSLLQSSPTMPFIVTNGDVIADIRYGDLIDFHIQQAAVATMAVSVHEWQHPFGVVQTRGLEIVGFEEKPIARTHINAGIYALDPFVLNFLAVGEYCDMPTLFERVRAASHRTVAYPMHEPWLDVGRPDDLLTLRLDTKQVLP